VVTRKDSKLHNGMGSFPHRQSEPTQCPMRYCVGFLFKKNKFVLKNIAQTIRK
jgi:hypothetical protein